MARLSLKQLLFAIAVGSLFAALQGNPPIPALAKLSAVSCTSQSTNRC
jgi:hypothetical protein